MAEIEIGILQRQCLARCAAEQDILAAEVAAWQSGETPLDVASTGALQDETRIES
jgi:hypothetical protein